MESSKRCEFTSPSGCGQEIKRTVHEYCHEFTNVSLPIREFVTNSWMVTSSNGSEEGNYCGGA